MILPPCCDYFKLTGFSSSLSKTSTLWRGFRSLHSSPGASQSLFTFSTPFLFIEDHHFIDYRPLYSFSGASQSLSTSPAPQRFVDFAQLTRFFLRLYRIPPLFVEKSRLICSADTIFSFVFIEFHNAFWKKSYLICSADTIFPSSLTDSSALCGKIASHLLSWNDFSLRLYWIL